jgi:hypothetical protein
VGRIIPYILEKENSCSKPPTRLGTDLTVICGCSLYSSPKYRNFWVCDPSVAQHITALNHIKSS